MTIDKPDLFNQQIDVEDAIYRAKERDPIRGQLVISKGSGRVVRVRNWDLSPAWFDGKCVGQCNNIMPARFHWRADFVKQQFRKMTDDELCGVNISTATK